VTGASAKTTCLRVAGLDFGTNTCLCLIADLELSEDKSEVRSLKVVRDEARVVRLGQGVHASRELHPEALARADETFREFGAYINEAKCDRVLAVATSAARDAKNRSVLLTLGHQYGIPIEIISGEKEAELTFSGAIESSWNGTTAVIDVGGGSTEIIFGDERGIFLRFSADVGSVRLTELFVKANPISIKELEEVRAHVRESIDRCFTLALAKFNESNHAGGAPLTRTELISRTNQVIGVAGTTTTLAAVDLGHAFESDKVHGHFFSRARLDEWTARLGKMSVLERQNLAGMEEKRADVIVAGAICVTEAMLAINGQTLKVSVRGLRYGVAKWCAVR
jgi:exopolyphosphatase/guanosine-5'-triphosphate,3'-diphosphate pyrophosphatase